MTREHPQQYVSPADVYAAVRCTNCTHLRYRDQRPGDPCQVCPCVEHVVSADAVTVEAPPVEDGAP